ncbi:PTS system fructose-specific IIA component [Pantoea sp. PA1]|jgi:PTS system fructose-specific IIA component|uniref:Fructose-like phosphotransferase enzyme IIA component FrvA n=2 Tax=Pantoea ananas TaxID=553 RepID=A0A0H3KZS5_PANAA|nr:MULTISPECIES: fructose PTS transporter subunit IIA [Pantoea]AER31254.1 fructose-like phosphotransferase enzyme IIA component FrvA [Pantoea ananatis PA13]AMB73436.1 PTS fructose transporter subunit IIA [Pantoea ananatis]ASN13742.1 PTS fructose transporter subunit IIA [Pantoea ananatis]AVG78386.1 PTS sugar transporter subunit IIA [Pantoea ananatis]AWQ17415.1 PTS fructose transporter subunit IIA [Pantoea ananatis]
MDISRILTPRRVNLNLQASSKEEAIIELTDLLFSDGAISDKQAFIKDVWLREAEGSTGFENHIAIPHGKSSAVKQTTLAIGRSQQDIPWETLDGSQVRCIILFAVRLEDQNTPHIRLLSQVASALADDEVIAQLLVENDPSEIIRLFSQYAETDLC